MVKYTNNLMSHIHIFKCFHEILFFSAFKQECIKHELKADFLRFNLGTKKHKLHEMLEIKG